MPKVRPLTEQQRMIKRNESLDDQIRGEVAKYRKANRVSVERLSQMMGLCKATMIHKLKKPDTFRLSEIRQLQQIMSSAEIPVKLPGEVFGC